MRTSGFPSKCCYWLGASATLDLYILCCCCCQYRQVIISLNSSNAAPDRVIVCLSRSCSLQIFTKYEKHRKLLLDDILASMARLPSSKRSLRSYRLNSEEQIQMLTALVLQLIQCMVVLPVALGSDKQVSWCLIVCGKN